MNKIALITDSTSDLPKEIQEMYNIEVLPLHVIYKDAEYEDGVDITPEEVYNSLPREIPTTSLPSAGRVVELFQRLKEEGYRDVLSIHISSGLSGTYAMIKNLEETAKNIGLRLHVIDSKSISMGLGFLVIKAAQLIESNTPLNEIISTLDRFKSEIKVFFVLKSLEYLRKGGRIGLVEGTLGDMLSIKPIISVNSEGIYYTVVKSRGRKGSIRKLVDIVKNAIGKSRVRVAVMHGNALDEAMGILQSIKDGVDTSGIFAGQVGPVVGVHTGPGLVGVGFCPE
ncbi:MAG: DegV family protein [Clostridia bacterium]